MDSAKDELQSKTNFHWATLTVNTFATLNPKHDVVFDDQPVTPNSSMVHVKNMITNNTLNTSKIVFGGIEVVITNIHIKDITIKNSKGTSCTIS